MSCPFPSSVGDGGLHCNLRQPQLHHRRSLCHLQPAKGSSFLRDNAITGGGFFQHRHRRYLISSTSPSYCHTPRASPSRNAAAPLASSSISACVFHGSPLHCEYQHLCLIQSYSYFKDVGGLSRRRTRRSCAHSQQHLSLQEDQQRLLRSQERREALQKYKSNVLSFVTQHQASLQQSALLAANLQTDGLIGYVPAGYDVSCSRLVFVANVHNKVSKKLLAEVFNTVGPLVACRLIRKPKLSYGFVEYQDHHAATMAISSLNGLKLFKLPIVVNWAFPSDSAEDLREHHKIFVGNLSAHITDTDLSKSFRKYPSCSIARVIWDAKGGRSRGYGFVSFREKEDAMKAIEEMSGKTIGDKEITCGWAFTKETAINKASGQNSMKALKNVAEDGQHTTVFVGNLAQEVSEEELREVFSKLGVGDIENVQVFRTRGYGFVRYSSHEGATLAIQAADGKIIGGKSLKCGWGTKPNLRSGSSVAHSPRPEADESPEALPMQPVENSPLSQE